MIVLAFFGGFLVLERVDERGGGGRCSELDRERGAWVPVGVVPAAARAG